MMADEEYRRCNVHREGVRPILEMIFAFFEWHFELVLRPPRCKDNLIFFSQ
jgi:hypothetical protein